MGFSRDFVPNILKTILRAFCPLDDMFKVKTLQKRFRDSFGGSSLDGNVWQSSVGSGGNVYVSSGQLVMTSGANANAETYVLSKDTFTTPYLFNIGLSLSQRIANQTFFIELVSVNPQTGIPDGKHCAAWVFDGTVATTGKYRVQNNSLTPVDSSGVTIPTTAGGSYYEIEPSVSDCWFHAAVMDSTNGRTNQYKKNQDIPDPNALYKIRLRFLNGATAPASSTTAAIRYVSVEDYAEITAEITSGRGSAVASQAISTVVANTPSVNVSNTPNVAISSMPTPTLHNLTSAASTNATSVKASAGTIYAIELTNTTAAAKYFKLFNKASAPVPGTDTPVFTIIIQPNSTYTLECGNLGLRFGTGIAYSITGAVGALDTTVVAAGDVVVLMSYQ